MATYFDPIQSRLVTVPEAVTSNIDAINLDGVQYFHQTTKPTTRPNGDALVVGDRWWKTDDGTEWFWNGTYWLSQQLFYSSHIFSSLSSTTTIFEMQLNMPMVIGSGIFVEDWGYRLDFFGGLTFTEGVDDWLFNVYLSVNNPYTTAFLNVAQNVSFAANLTGSETQSVSTQFEYKFSTNFGKLYTATSFPARWELNATKVGNPPSLVNTLFSVTYRWIA